MPGFFATNFEVESDYTLENYDNNRCISDSKIVDQNFFARNVLNSFLEDKLFADHDDYFVMTDGYLLNKESLVKQEKTSDFAEIIYRKSLQNNKFDDIEGAISGLIYDKAFQTITVFTNPLGDRAIFYYFDEKTGKFIIGSQLNYVTDAMSKLNIQKEIDLHGVTTFLNFGYFIDESTFLKSVKRLYPGDFLNIKDNNIEIKNYFIANYTQIELPIDDAIEALDIAFKKALNKIKRKSMASLKSNILDLSGGLDSRMICFSAKNLEMKNSTLITYAQTNSSEQRVASKVARILGWNWYFKSLDNGSCLKQIDDLTKLNNGVSYYFGITGGRDFLEFLYSPNYAFELTGLLGDIAESAMITTNGNCPPDPFYGRYRTSKMIDFDEHLSYSNVTNRFSNNELYWLYTRGMLAGMSTFFIRQNFIEPITPFGDLDFLKAYLSLPWNFRVKNRPLFLWLKKKYPQAANIEYAGFGMSFEQEHKLFYKMYRRFKNYFVNILSKITRRPNPNNMNPLDFWLKQKETKEYLENYYSNNLHYLNHYPEIKEKIEFLFLQGKSFMDKGLALTVISYFKNYLQ